MQISSVIGRILTQGSEVRRGGRGTFHGTRVCRDDIMRGQGEHFMTHIFDVLTVMSCGSGGKHFTCHADHVLEHSVHLCRFNRGDSRGGSEEYFMTHIFTVLIEVISRGEQEGTFHDAASWRG